MALQTVTLGDATTISVPMRTGGAAFTPAAGYQLIFTAKLATSDLDAAAVIQKKSGGFGLTESTSSAVIALLPIDTSPLAGGITLYCDVQAQKLSDAADIKTVSTFQLLTVRDVTRLTNTSITVYTSEPVPSGVTTNDSKLALTGLANGQEVEITNEGKRLERYTGDTAGLYTSIDIVGNATTAGVHGYGVFHWEPTYGNFLSVYRSSPGTNFHAVTHDGTKWQLWLGTSLHSYAPNSAATVNPADVVGAWTFVGDGGGTGTVDEVNAVPIATERNWHTLKNTVYLTVKDDAGSGPYEFNGVTVGASATVAVGWVPVSELILVKGAADWYVDAVNSDTSFQFGTKTTVTHVIVIGTNVILADDFPNGALVTIASD